MSHVRVGKIRVKLPRSKTGRKALGGALVAGSALWFLPVLGLWMLPAGLLVLSVDSPRERGAGCALVADAAGRRRS